MIRRDDATDDDEIIARIGGGGAEVRQALPYAVCGVVWPRTDFRQVIAAVCQGLTTSGKHTIHGRAVRRKRQLQSGRLIFNLEGDNGGVAKAAGEISRSCREKGGLAWNGQPSLLAVMVVHGDIEHDGVDSLGRR